MKKRYRLYVDESGDHSYGKKELRKIQLIIGKERVELPINQYPELRKDDKRYLGLLGLIIESEYYRTVFYPELEKLKQSHFPYNPDDPIVLHRRELINKSGPFWRLKDPEKEKNFNGDLLAFLKKQNYKLILVVIDKMAHVLRYGEFAYHPYHYCLAALLERYCGFLNFIDGEGDVLAESRGGTEDKELKKAYRNLYESGTQFREPSFFQKTLTSKEIKLKQKSANIAGLQIADLLVYPLKQEYLVEKGRISKLERDFGDEICAAVKGKYNCQIYTGRISGYGKVFLK